MRRDRARLFVGITSSRSSYLVWTDGVCAVIYVQVIVAVQLQEVEPEHEPLQDRVRLERDHAVEIPLVPRPEHRAVDLPVELLQEVVLAEGLHRI